MLYKDGLVYTYLECKNSTIDQHVAINKRRSCIGVGQKCSNLVTNALEDATTDRPTNDDQAKYKLDVQSQQNGPPFNLRHNAASLLFYWGVVTYYNNTYFKQHINNIEYTALLSHNVMNIAVLHSDYTGHLFFVSLNKYALTVKRWM